MAAPHARAIEERLNDWVQIVAIIGAGIWGAYTFYFKEIHVPETAPINISMSLQLKITGVGEDKNPLQAVELHIAANNPSTRDSYILPSWWMVYGHKIEYHDAEPAQSFRQKVEAALNAPDYTNQRPAQFYSVKDATILVAGRLFIDEALGSGEKVERIVVFYIPKQGQDAISVTATMPSLRVKRDFGIKYTVSEDGVVSGALCQRGAKTVCTPLRKTRAVDTSASGIRRRLLMPNLRCGSNYASCCHGQPLPRHILS